jgi:DNA polymerase III epsilon subunit-like protein
MCVLSEDMGILDELDLKLKPDDGRYLTTPKAMQVNGIDLTKHDADPSTLTYSQAKPVFRSFLEKHHAGGRHASLRICGHNIAFDLAFIHHYLMPKAEFERYVHYRVLDTTPLCTFFQDIGLWPEKLGPLTSLVDFLGVQKRDAHNAKEDTLMWVDVYKAILRQEKSRTSGGASTPADELVLLEL